MQKEKTIGVFPHFVQDLMKLYITSPVSENRNTYLFVTAYCQSIFYHLTFFHLHHCIIQIIINSLSCIVKLLLSL